MGKTILFANQKGGVGKTTTTVNVGAYLADAGQQVLLVDFDPQANLTSSVGLGNEERGTYELLSGSLSPQDLIRETPVKRLSILPASIHLSGATVELVGAEGANHYLSKALDPIRDQFDFLLIDSPPSLGVLTINGLTAADEVIIPLQTEYFALEGLTQLVQSIRLIQKGPNSRLEIGGIVFTMHDARTRLGQDVIQEVIGYFGDKVFKTIIPRNVRLSEAPSHGVPINLFDPTCLGARSYQQLAAEVLQRAEKRTR